MRHTRGGAPSTARQPPRPLRHDDNYHKVPARPDPPGPPQHADPRAPSPIPTQDGDDWIEKLDAIALAAGYNRTLRGARNLEQIVAKLDPSRADILMSQLRPAILQPAYILVRDRVEKKLFFVIRGTHSVRDTVTSLTANSRPHHAIGEDGAPIPPVLSCRPIVGGENVAGIAEPPLLAE